MNRDMKNLTKLALLASDLEPVASAKIAACLVHRGEIISYGFNQNKSSTFQSKWSKNSESVFWHSETNAIHNALKRYDVEELQNMKTTLYVCRIKKLLVNPKTKEFVNVWGASNPCVGCSKCITHHNINRVVFSLDAEEIADERFAVWYP